MIETEKIDTDKAAEEQAERLDAYKKKLSKASMDKSDVLKIALAIQGIAVSVPKGVLVRIEEYLKDIETIIGKYAGGDDEEN